MKRLMRSSAATPAKQAWRRLEQVLAKLCRKAAKHIADGDESLTATKENLEELLGTATFKDDLVSKKDESAL